LRLLAPARATYPELIHAAGAAALARARSLTGLRQLELDNNAIGDGGLASLAGSAVLSRLIRLSLVNNQIGLAGDEAIERLCESPHLTRLNSLNLLNNPISRRGRRLLRDRFGASVFISETG
jgi:hypothetical protein